MSLTNLKLAALGLAASIGIAASPAIAQEATTATQEQTTAICGQLCPGTVFTGIDMAGANVHEAMSGAFAQGGQTSTNTAVENENVLEMVGNATQSNGTCVENCDVARVDLDAHLRNLTTSNGYAEATGTQADDGTNTAVAGTVGETFQRSIFQGMTQILRGPAQAPSGN